MRRHFASWLVALGAALAVASSSDARAQSAVPLAGPTPPETSATTEWYGWQTLLVDGAALMTMAAGTAKGREGAGYIGLAVYALGPPVVHVAHGRWDVALGDLLARAGAPIVFGLIGFGIDRATNPCPPPDPNTWFDLCFSGLAGAVVGGLIGYASAVIFDATVLARAPIGKKPHDDGAYRLRWSPIVGATPRGGVTAGVGAVF